MDYERIDKVQTGIISPSKLRLKLIGPHHQKRKDGTNYNSSSRTSPSKLDDAEFVKNSLLASKNGNFDDEGSSKDFEGVSSPHIVAPPIEVSSVKVSGEGASNSGQGDQTCFQPTDILPKEIGEMGLVKIQQLSRDYPMKSLEDNPDYDSNACSSRFEFYKGERSLHNHMVRPFSRSMSSKWNDAEKWIVNRQPVHLNHSKKTTVQNLVNRQPMTSLVRVVPESTSSDQKTSVIPVMDTRQINSHHLTAQIGLDKFTFSTPETHPISDSADAENVSVDLCLLSREEKEVNYKELSGSEKLTANIAGFPVIRSVAMRDMGTEMTPVTSQEPSRTATPVGATTPLRSPTSSIPSTPGRGAPAPTPVETRTNDESKLQEEGSKKELSEQELKLKTRREIIALGVQLGKMNIAAWASKDEREKNASFIESTDEEKLARIEFENRAAAWEEVEKSKHTARYKHEEIKIQAWESRQKAKMEADMRRIEAKAKQMRVHSQEKMKKKIAIARQRSEEKRAAAEAKRNRQAARTAAQAEYIRQTGSIPSSYFICCSCYHKF